MADNSAWRYDCCNIMRNALADDPRATLTFGIQPYARRGSRGVAFTAVVHNEGKILASCRHDVGTMPFMFIHEQIGELIASRFTF